MNGKDILVLFLHVVLLYGMALYYRQRIWLAMIFLFFTSLALFFLRLYVPLLFTAAFAATSLASGHGWKRMKSVLAGGVFLGTALAWIGSAALKGAVARLSEDFVNPLFGFIRFLLTPIPFHTETAYAFLDIPAFVHWLLMPVAAMGMVMVFRRRTTFARFLAIYLLTFIALYAVYEKMQGPRHRVQLDYAWAVLQFSGLLVLIRGCKARGHPISRPSFTPPTAP